MIVLDLDDKNDNYVTTEIHGENFYQILNKIKKIPRGEYDPDRKIWRFPRDKKIINKLMKKFETACQANKYVLAGEKEPYVPTASDMMMNSIDKDLNHYIDQTGIDGMKLELFDFQKLAVMSALFILNKYNGFLIADDMGLGKTAEALGTAFALKDELNNIIVSCPKNVKYQWSHEVEKFTDFKPVVVDGYNKQKRLEQFDKDGDIFIINHDQLILDDDMKKMKKLDPDMMIVDEIHYFKNHSAQRTEALKKLGEQSKYQLGLTGTQLQNHPSDIHSIYEFLIPDLLNSWKKFKNKYIFYSYKYGYPKEMGYKNLFKLKRQISKYMIRRKTTDVRDDLPVDKKKPHYIKMNNTQHRLHQEVGEKIDQFKDKEEVLRMSDEDKSEEVEELEGKILGYMNIQSEIADDLRVLAESTSYIVEDLIEDVEPGKSPKTQLYLKLIEKILNYNPDFKIVTFSKFARMVQMLKNDILNKNLSKEVAVIYGQ